MLPGTHHHCEQRLEREALKPDYTADSVATSDIVCRPLIRSPGQLLWYLIIRAALGNYTPQIWVTEQNAETD